MAAKFPVSQIARAVARHGVKASVRVAVLAEPVIVLRDLDHAATVSLNRFARGVGPLNAVDLRQGRPQRAASGSHARAGAAGRAAAGAAAVAIAASSGARLAAHGARTGL